MSPAPARAAAVPILAGLFAGMSCLPAAADYDIDCAVILCMAAGFPDEPSGTCSEAYDHMLDRITDHPPKPPVGTCTMSDGSAYEAATVAVVRPPRQSRAGWICPEPAPMRFDETADYGVAAPGCYPDAEYTPPTFMGRPGYWFPGAPVAAERVAYRFQITIPTGADRGADAGAYVSPIFLTDPETGFARTVTADALRAFEEQPAIPVDGAP